MGLLSRLRRATPLSTSKIGAAAEERARIWLIKQGLCEIEHNFYCRGGEIDLIMQDRGTLVFVEVRKRSSSTYGGALNSITPAKQKRLILAAHLFLQRYRVQPPCRFDVIGFDGDTMHWVKNAFDAA